MIAGDERSRFFVSEGDGIPGGETTWYIVDWDQRRTITVTVDEYRFDDEVAVEYLNKYMHQLPYDFSEGGPMTPGRDMPPPPPDWYIFVHASIAEEVPQGYDKFIESVTADLESDPCRVRKDFPPPRNIPGNTGDEAVAKIAKRWLQRCKEDHGCEKQARISLHAWSLEAQAICKAATLL
ncbi:hypothetical protein ACJ41O_006234 [Fusarium nematophilum]